jgi:lambda family phage minor tail protein L
MNISDLTGLSLDAAIDLYELTGWNTANLTQVFRFSDSYGVTFAGNVYQPFACKVGGITWSATGSLPQGRLTLADPLGLVSTLVNNNRISGATLKYTQTRAKFLDGAPSANTSKFMPPQIFSVSHPEAFIPNKQITFVLEPEIYKMSNTIGRRVAASCQAVFKDGVTCPYTGVLTTCNKRLTGSGGCEGRFPNQSLPALSVGFYAEKIIR